MTIFVRTASRLKLAIKLLKKQLASPFLLQQEIRAIGFANILGALFHCYTTTGSFSRSAVNNSCGAQSRASRIHALCMKHHRAPPYVAFDACLGFLSLYLVLSTCCWQSPAHPL